MIFRFSREELLKGLSIVNYQGRLLTMQAQQSGTHRATPSPAGADWKFLDPLVNLSGYPIHHHFI